MTTKTQEFDPKNPEDPKAQAQAQSNDSAVCIPGPPEKKKPKVKDMQFSKKDYNYEVESEARRMFRNVMEAKMMGGWVHSAKSSAEVVKLATACIRCSQLFNDVAIGMDVQDFKVDRNNRFEWGD